MWDLKAHTDPWRAPRIGALTKGQAEAEAPLNDQEAMDTCVTEHGLGFLTVGGEAINDEDGAFVESHREFNAVQGVKSLSPSSGKSRARESTFEPLRVEAFWFANTAALDAAKPAGQFTGFTQGKQAPDEDGAEGLSRRPKYNLSVQKSRDTAIAFPAIPGRTRSKSTVMERRVTAHSGPRRAWTPPRGAPALAKRCCCTGR